MTPHTIVTLPNTNGMQLLLCYDNEGVYVNTYGKVSETQRDVVSVTGDQLYERGVASGQSACHCSLAKLVTGPARHKSLRNNSSQIKLAAVIFTNSNAKQRGKRF